MSFPLIRKKSTKKLEQSSRYSVDALSRLQRIILNTLDFNEVVKNSVNSVLSELGYLELGYRIIVLTLIDPESQTLRRFAISQTKEAQKALEVTPVPFKDIVIPLTELDNLSIKSINTASVLHTNNWFDILRPAYTEEEAIKVQQIVGIKSSMTFPLIVRAKPIGSIIFSMVKDYTEVTEDEKELLSSLTDLVAIAVQNSTLYTSLAKTSSRLNEANIKLQELDQLKDDFVSIASHELRTPMTAIRSYSWMALYKPDIQLSEKMKKYLTRTLVSTERLINLVNDMLNISRIESGRVEIAPQAFNLVGLFNDILAEVEVKAKEKNLHLQIIDSKPPQIFADPDKVHQVILNLVGNAMKFTPNDGTIRVSFFSQGEFVEVSIKDSGVGISKEDQSKLFRKFGRLDNSYVATASSGGTGLGLFICKSLIELMGGKIWAESEGPGKGTTFKFNLPTATDTVIQNSKKFTNHVQGEAKPLEPAAI